MRKEKTTSSMVVIDKDGLDLLIQSLRRAGHEVIGPTAPDGAVVYEPIKGTGDLPRGMEDDQDGGHYRLKAATGGKGVKEALFRYVVGPHSWKRYLFPPSQKLWSAERKDGGWTIDAEQEKPAKQAFIGVRPCELAAMRIQDRVFSGEAYKDRGYAARRDATLVIAVNCTRAGGTCFCTSMDTGPVASDGYDLALTEISDGKDHRFVVTVGSKRGAKALKKVPQREATAGDRRAANSRTNAAAKSMGRTMPKNAAKVLRDNPDHPQWTDVAERCLNCANCTMVCPTCFCSNVVDVTTLDGAGAERWRRWDSCFTVDFSYIHGGPIRRDAASRYRQWITHKLSSWHDQFGSSGCTGCGRCIIWCPVGIDITAEARAIGARPKTAPKGER